MLNAFVVNTKLQFCKMLLIWLLILLFTPIAFAQSGATTGAIVGRVTDKENLAINGAKVVVKNLKTNSIRTIETNSDGIYQATQLPPGTYEIITSTPGFEGQKTKAVLNVGVTAVIDISLNIRNINNLT